MAHAARSYVSFANAFVALRSGSTKETQSMGVGSLDEQISASFSLTATVRSEVLHALERLLRDNQFVDGWLKRTLMQLRFSNDCYYDMQVPRLSELWGRKHAPKWLVEPGWSARQFLLLVNYLCTPKVGLLPSMKRRVESLKRKAGLGAASEEEKARADSGRRLLEQYESMRYRLTGPGCVGFGTRELSLRCGLEGMEFFELLQPAVIEKALERLAIE